MASQPGALEISSTMERPMRSRDMSHFLPFILGFSNNNQQRRHDQQNGDQTYRSDRVFLVNPFTQGMVVVEGASVLESLLRQIGNGNKEGQPPAAKSAVEALPRVEISSEEMIDGGEECAICLEEFRMGDSAKDMPCKHRFHGDCVEKWLGIHGTCPVCRHKMPVEEGESESKRGVSSQREIWVRFLFRNNTSTSQEDDEEEEVDDDEEQEPN